MNVIYNYGSAILPVRVDMETPFTNKLNQQVLGILQDRISRGELGKGTWLRETALAQDLGVSRNPIRWALDRLVKMGVAERLPNRGVRVIQRCRIRRGKPVSTDMRTLSERATDALLGRIIGSDDNACQTSVTALAKDLGISRTPVRRALDRLAQLGLAECARRGRVYLGCVDADRVANVYDVRAELEGMTAEYAATRMDPEVLNQLAGVNKELAEPDRPSKHPHMVSQEFHLHHSIAEFCGQAYLHKLLKDIFDLVSAFQRAGYGTADMADRAVYEHGIIISALQKRDGKLARQSMVQHIRATCQTIMARMQ